MKSLTLESKVTLKEAYLIMFDFLEKYWERTGKPDAIGGLLGDLSLGDTNKEKNQWTRLPILTGLTVRGLF